MVCFFTQVAKDMYDAKDADFAMRVMKSSIVRAQICIDFVEKAGKAFTYLESWHNSFASMFTIGTLCFFMIFPQFIIPATLLGIITKCVMTYPSSFDKQVRRVNDLSARTGLVQSTRLLATLTLTTRTLLSAV